MYKYIKRILDIAVSALGLIILSPAFLLLGILIKLESKGPVFFRQTRYGKDKVPFECLKFRSMIVEAPANEATKDLKDADRFITKSGKVLRRLGIDELPQLINVLKGEMSIIGPRPVVLAETDLIAERDKYGANAMTPGIGGWAQSNGRDEVDYKNKARLDGEYTQNFGFKMDMSCVWRTMIAIFTSDGFKEGHFGDTEYKHQVHSRTRKISPVRRAISKIRQGAKSRANIKQN